MGGFVMPKAKVKTKNKIKIKQDIKKYIEPVVGGLLVLLIITAIVSNFTRVTAVSTFSLVAFITTAGALLLSYFGWLAVRSSLLFGAVAVVLVVSAYAFNYPTIKKNQYQAVLLTNGQVYFGHLKKADSRNPVLQDVYYLKSSQKTPSQPDQSQAQLVLIKLSKDADVPSDELILKTDQILYWQNMDNSGKIVKLIQQDKGK